MYNRHRRFEKWNYLYREGELSARQAGTLRRHLAHCESCRVLAESLTSLRRAVEQAQLMETPQPPGDAMIHTVLNRLATEKPAPGFWDRLALPAPRLAAAAVLVLILGGYLGQEGRDQRRLESLAARNGRSQVLFVRQDGDAEALLRLGRRVLSLSAGQSGHLARLWSELSPAQRARFRATISLNVNPSGVLR